MTAAESIVQFTVSPDFGPDRIAGWYVFNTWLQHACGHRVHLELYSDFAAQRRALQAGAIDLIYANPFDAAELVREQGFLAVAKPFGASDEVVLAVAADSPITVVEDLGAPAAGGEGRGGDRDVVVAATDDPDVRLIGMILLEPADLEPTELRTVEAPSYVLVAKAVLDGSATVGVFYRTAWDNLSGLVRRQLRPLVTSEISVIHHALMIGPRLRGWREPLTSVLTGMGEDPQSRGVLDALGIDHWVAVHDEETEFMIDLMNTLA